MNQPFRALHSVPGVMRLSVFHFAAHTLDDTLSPALPSHAPCLVPTAMPASGAAHATLYPDAAQAVQHKCMACGW
eukprot:3040603-Rhodomonas_salina.1